MDGAIKNVQIVPRGGTIWHLRYCLVMAWQLMRERRAAPQLLWGAAEPVRRMLNIALAHVKSQ